MIAYTFLTSSLKKYMGCLKKIRRIRIVLISSLKDLTLRAIGPVQQRTSLQNPDSRRSVPRMVNINNTQLFPLPLSRRAVVSDGRILANFGPT